MTSRNFDVVTKEEYVYKLKPLSHENSKTLFNERILSGEGECVVDQSDELFDKILRKCGGVPLAIIAIASLLVDKPWKKWSEVYESMVSGHRDSTMEIISYSYEDLPSYLKPCILYMSKFLEDYLVMKYSLIWMWIGEGFVHIEKEGDNIFEQGERYFNMLLNRSMLQPIEDNIDRSISACHVHDIVYDLINHLSGEENFTSISIREHYTSCKVARRRKEMSLTCSKTKVRRLSLQSCHFECIPHETLGMPDGVRSLYIINSATDTTPQIYRFQVCRLLCIEHSNIPNLRHLGNLLHLRYLEINSTKIDELSEEIVYLKSLQTLILIRIGINRLSMAVCALTQLMCLNIMGIKSLPTNRMGNLVHPEELELCLVQGRYETDDLAVQLSKLTRLRVLNIRFAEEMDQSTQNALVNSIRSLEIIQDLKLSFPELMNASIMWQGWVPPRQLWRLLIPNIVFSCLPVWISPLRLPRLSSLDVYARVVQEQDLDNLARLPELSYLRLQGLLIHQGYTVGATSGFKKLRVCNVEMAFKFLPGAMPSLEILSFWIVVAVQRRIVDCVEYEILPTKDAIGELDLGLGNLLSLEQVDIYVDCKGARKSDVEDGEVLARRQAKDHPKHPTLSIERIGDDLMLCDELAEHGNSGLDCDVLLREVEPWKRLRGKKLMLTEWSPPLTIIPMQSY